MNEKRIYLMTRLAIFEESHKEQLQGVRTFFRSDYIGRHMIKNGLRVTAAFLCILAGWGMYHAETLMLDITKIDVWGFGKHILFLYAVWLSFFLVMTYSIQSVRYARARKDLEKYREMLTRLEQEYDREEKRQMMRPVRREEKA